MKVMTPRTLNYPRESVPKLLMRSSANKAVVKANSLHQLVTRFGVSPEKAKKLLGF